MAAVGAPFSCRGTRLREWKYPWGAIEQTNDSESASESCEIPTGGKMREAEAPKRAFVDFSAVGEV